MSQNNIKLIVLLFVMVCLWLNDAIANEIDCQSQYRACVIENFDAQWALWEEWSAGQLNMSLDKFDTKHIDSQYSILACDEITLACNEDREPDFDKFLQKQQSFPEADWPVSTSEKVGLDEKNIQQAISSAQELSGFRSLLVVKDGKLVTEEYFTRKDDPRPQHVQSVTKSITSLLIGIAIDQGFIQSEKEVIKPFFPEYFSKPHDERKQNITVEQLLTMTSRLNFADNPVTSSYENTRHWQEPGSWKAYWYSDNYLDRALNIDLVETDDEIAMIYNTPACNLLTTVLKRSANMSSKEFADKYLFGPLGIKNYHWHHDSDYNYIGGHTIFIRPRDLAKIGQMVLDGGKHEGQQIVSKEWLEKSFQAFVPKILTTDDGKTVFDYGYLWWMGQHQGYKYQLAWGHGGQFLLIVPDANLLVVTTAYPDPTAYTHWERSQRIINEMLYKVIEALPN